MTKNKSLVPMPDPRRQAAKRHFKGLVMPPVPHPRGAPIESCEPPTSPKSRRMAKLLLSVAGLLALGAIVFIGIYGRPKHSHPPGKPCPAKHAGPEHSGVPAPSPMPSK